MGPELKFCSCLSTGPDILESTAPNLKAASSPCTGNFWTQRPCLMALRSPLPVRLPVPSHFRRLKRLSLRLTMYEDQASLSPFLMSTGSDDSLDPIVPPAQIAILMILRQRTRHVFAMQLIEDPEVVVRFGI